jgi:hypothetical protein
MKTLHRPLILMALWMGLLLPPATTAAPGFFIHNGDRVVFLGDSITEQRLYTTYIEAYALSRYPKWNLTFRNVGWGGDTAWLRQRAHPDEANSLRPARTNSRRWLNKPWPLAWAATSCRSSPRPSPSSSE